AAWAARAGWVGVAGGLLGAQLTAGPGSPPGPVQADTYVPSDVSGHQRQPDAELRVVALVVAQERLAVAVEVLGVQVTVHAQERALQGPRRVDLRHAAPAVALAIQGREHQPVVLRPPQLPVDDARIVGVVPVFVAFAEVALQAR